MVVRRRRHQDTYGGWPLSLACMHANSRSASLSLAIVATLPELTFEGSGLTTNIP